MMRQWAIALACAGCLVATNSARAQWGLMGQDADPRYDCNVAGNAAIESKECMPGVEITAGYLAWWFRPPNVNATLATGTSSSIGPGSFSYDSPFTGGELRARFWLDNTQTGSFEVGGFILGQRTETAYAGGTAASADSFLWGADANLVVNTLSPVDLIAGFRYLDLKEDLDITTAGAAATTIDHFYTRNQFYGGQFGARACYHWCMFTFVAESLLGLGDVHQTLEVAGGNSAGPGGGTFATTANSGVFIRDEFGVLVQTDFKVAVDVCNGVQWFVGYDFLYLNQVLRPFNQVTTPGAAAPLDGTYFWAQGISTGVCIRY